MFKRLLIIGVITSGLASVSIAKMCEIPEDIKNRYEEAIQHMKDQQISGYDITKYKENTLGDGRTGSGSYWFSTDSKKDDWEKDCKKKEEYYRKAYNMLIADEKAGKRTWSGSVDMYINEQYYKSAIDAERTIRSKAYDLATYDNL